MTTTILEIEELTSSDVQASAAVNEALQILDAEKGMVTIDIANANHTLTSAGPPHQWHYGLIKITSTPSLSANREVTCPDNAKRYLLWNAGGGAFTVTLKTASGTGIAVAQDRVALLQCDGTNVVRLTPDAVLT